MKKRLVVCCDGTWQTLTTEYPTNVVKIAQAIKPVSTDGTHQIIYYDEGIGTETSLRKYSGGLFGKGMDQNIREAYRFLSLNYEDGDQIYLFGYSRGAYTVRSLAGLIYNSGIIGRQEIRRAPEAFSKYRDLELHPESQELVNFRNDYSHTANITLLACWDTVGALGIPNTIPWLPLDKIINRKYRFHDTKLNQIIKHAFHAVAIDERRKTFNVTLMTKSKRASNIDLKQVWFVGDHGAVGGGSVEKSGLSDITLEWVIEQIRDAGLGLDMDESVIPTGLKPNYKTLFDNRVTGFKKIMGTIDREIAGGFDDIHNSVKERWKDIKEYKPLKLKESFGNKLQEWINEQISDV